MAFGANEFTITKRLPIAAGVQMVVGKWTPSAAYTSGGETITQAICKAAFGLNTIYWMQFAPLVAANGATIAYAYFDHTVVAGTSQGKIRIVNANSPHLHDLLIIGGQGAGQAVQILPDGASPVLGKTTATSRTVASAQGTNGVQNNSVATIANLAATEATAGIDFSSGAHSARFILFGTA